MTRPSAARANALRSLAGATGFVSGSNPLCLTRALARAGITGQQQRRHRANPLANGADDVDAVVPASKTKVGEHTFRRKTGRQNRKRFGMTRDRARVMRKECMTA